MTKQEDFDKVVRAKERATIIVERAEATLACCKLEAEVDRLNTLVKMYQDILHKHSIPDSTKGE